MSNIILDKFRNVILATWRGQSDRLSVQLYSHLPSNLYTVKYQAVGMQEVIYQLVADTDEEAVATIQEMVDAEDFNPESIRWTRFGGVNG